MLPTIRTLLLGPDGDRFGLSLDLLFVAALGVGTFLAYAVDAFQVAGGVVFLPGDAVLVGVLGAGLLGSRRRGLLVAWLAVYGTMLAYSADHYLLGLSGRSLAEKVGAFLQPDGLVFFGVAALVLGTIGWAVGVAAGLALDALRTAAADQGS